MVRLNSCEGRALLPVIKDLHSMWSSESQLSLDQRTYHCEARGLSIDRDVNAAINLARQGLAGTHSVTGRGGEVRPSQQKLAEEAHPDEASTDTPPEVGA